LVVVVGVAVVAVVFGCFSKLVYVWEVASMFGR
jgi:hypothetical protein